MNLDVKTVRGGSIMPAVCVCVCVRVLVFVTYLEPFLA